MNGQNSNIHDGGLKILIVEDEVSLQRSLKFILKGLGHQTHTAINGTEALIKIKSANDENSDFDLLLLDWNIPSNSSEHLFKQLKLLRVPLPVLVMSQDKPRNLQSLMNNSEIQAFLSKPFSKNELMEQLAHFTNKSNTYPSSGCLKSQTHPKTFKGESKC